MRVAVLCDVHGNLPALEAVLAEVASLEVDRIVVRRRRRRGAVPARVPRQARRSRRGLRPRQRGPRVAARARGNLGWVAGSLDPLSVEFLRELPQAVSLGGVLYCHGSPRDDDEILTRDLARRAVSSRARGVRGAPRRRRAHARPVRARGRRDPVRQRGQRRHAVRGQAGRVLGARGRRRVEFRHTPYAVDAAVAAIRASGYPERGSDRRLAARAGGPGRGVRVLREHCHVASSARRAGRVGPKTRADPADHRAAGRRACRRADRARPSATTSSCSSR